LIGYKLHCARGANGLWGSGGGACVGVAMAFGGYRFEHPRDEDRVIVVRGWSYVWAGLLGCVYVAALGSRSQLLRALALDLAYFAVFAAIVSGSFLLPPTQQAGVVVVSAPLLVMLHGAATIRLVRDSYRRRGWLVHRA
jgi:hypothetical protein